MRYLTVPGGTTNQTSEEKNVGTWSDCNRIESTKRTDAQMDRRQGEEMHTRWKEGALIDMFQCYCALCDTSHGLE